MLSSYLVVPEPMFFALPASLCHDKFEQALEKSRPQQAGATP